MQEYIEKLHKELHEIMERPVTLGRAEEVMVYANAICALRKLSGDHFREPTKMMEFTEDDAKAWTARMENTDGTTGPHWPIAQTTAVMVSRGYHYDPAVWYAAMNMIYSDYHKTAKKHGVDTQDYYTDMTVAFLDDKDASGPEEKISAYYHCIAS